MKVHVGSKNKTKVNGVKEALSLYPKLFPEAVVEGIDVQIELFGHPKNLDEVMRGARDRAEQAFTGADYSFGIESGLVPTPHSRTGYLEVAACVIYDGKQHAVGFAPAFEWPKKVLNAILNEGMDASTAFKKLGMTEHEKLGAMDGGMCGFFTKGRFTREEQTRASIIMALIQLENPEMY